MREDTIVKLTKLKTVVDRGPGSLQKDYWLAGFLINPIKVGEEIVVYRQVRNGVVTPGFFTSSPVDKIEEQLIYTQNSIWRLEIIDDSTLNKLLSPLQVN